MFSSPRSSKISARKFVKYVVPFVEGHMPTRATCGRLRASEVDEAGSSSPALAPRRCTCACESALMKTSRIDSALCPRIDTKAPYPYDDFYPQIPVRREKLPALNFARNPRWPQRAGDRVEKRLVLVLLHPGSAADPCRVSTSIPSQQRHLTATCFLNPREAPYICRES